MNKVLKIQISNQLSEIRKIRKELDKFYNFHNLPAKITNVIDMAVEEIITNLISYAYEDNYKHEINIQLSLTNVEIILEINDDGRPFNPLEKSIPDTSSSIEDRPIGGLGIHIVKKLMDSVDYKYKGNRNCLIMKKNIN